MGRSAIVLLGISNRVEENKQIGRTLPATPEISAPCAYVPRGKAALYSTFIEHGGFTWEIEQTDLWRPPLSCPGRLDPRGARARRGSPGRIFAEGLDMGFEPQAAKRFGHLHWFPPAGPGFGPERSKAARVPRGGGTSLAWHVQQTKPEVGSARGCNAARGPPRYHSMDGEYPLVVGTGPPGTSL